MTSHNETLSTPSSQTVTWLWIPYVLIATVFIVFLGVNFWCYHKRNRQRYLRKRDEKRVKDGLYERRKIIALMRAQFQVKVPPTNQNSVGTLLQSQCDSNTLRKKLQKEASRDQNGSIHRPSIEDSFDYADDLDPSISELDLDEDMYGTPSIRKIAFVSSVCPGDGIGSGVRPTCFVSKRGLASDNGTINAFCK